ncbi:MAG: sugar phosphate isomerase/epimerase [Verrucomicrobiales bacterium]|jgi:sugar phosphate isomerase/epimerase
MNRRESLRLLAGAAALPVTLAAGDEVEIFRLRYILSSAMYGEMPLDVILPEVAKTGAAAIDIWCRVHGNQREQIDEMGHAAALDLLKKHKVTPAVFTRYAMGPFGLQEEMAVVKKFGGEILVTGSTGPSEPSGQAAKQAVKAFLEKLKPHVAAAEAHGLVIAIENHDRQLLYHPDALRYFAEMNTSSHLGIALALHHLHAFEDEIPALIRELGDRSIPFIYFQEHSEGIRKKVPKEIEMQQLPGHGGGLDYRPVVSALKDINYGGYCEIFMHPVPRGIPILPTAEAITAAINKSRSYIAECLKS